LSKFSYFLALAYIRSGDKTASVQALQDLSAKYEQDLEQEGVIITA